MMDLLLYLILEFIYNIALDQKLAGIFYIVNIFSFAGHTVSVATVQLCCYNQNSCTENVNK